MSNYLNSLVGRALRLEPVVQPRPASLFEPVVAQSFNEHAPAEVSETRATRDASWPSPRTTDEVSEIRVRTRENIPARELPNTVVRSRPMPATLLPPPELPPSLFSIHATENPPAVRDKEHLSTDSDGVSSAKELTPLLIRPEVRVAPATTSREQSQPSLRTPSLTAVPAHVAPPSPFSPARNLNAQASAPTEAPETIVVTIGRVDVRAVFPQPQPAPRAGRSQPQPLSLDEYLKQRNEGRR